MPRSGQARVLTPAQKRHLFDVIQQHRHPEKNTAIMQVSFKLGLRAQEIALLQVKEVAQLLNRGTQFKLLECRRCIKMISVPEQTDHPNRY